MTRFVKAIHLYEPDFIDSFTATDHSINQQTSANFIDVSTGPIRVVSFKKELMISIETISSKSLFKMFIDPL